MRQSRRARLSREELDAEITGAFGPELGSLRDSIRNMVGELNAGLEESDLQFRALKQLMEAVSRVAGQVSGEADSVMHSSRSLSQGALEQAGVVHGSAILRDGLGGS